MLTKYMMIITLLTAMSLGRNTAHSTPPCQCNVSIYKRKKRSLPCLVSIVRDSASQEPLSFVSLLLINNIVWRSDKDGKTYADVVSNKKYRLTAKAYFYQPCIRKLRPQDGDSIVCIFNMRRDRQPSDRPGDFIHK